MTINKTIVIESSRIDLWHELKELYAQKELLFSLTSREIKSRYKQTLFGFLWAILPAFALMGIMTLIFSFFIKIETGPTPYPVFSLTALIPWMFFTRSVEHGTRALVSNAGLITKIYFPREILLLSIILANFFDFLIGLASLFVLFLYFQIPLSVHYFWLFPLMALQILLTLTIILLTSSINVVFRDIAFLMPLLFQIWFYISPIIYPLERVPSEWLGLYMLNPIAILIHSYRTILLYQQMPPMEYILPLTLTLTLFCMLGYRHFKKAERYFTDII